MIIVFYSVQIMQKYNFWFFSKLPVLFDLILILLNVSIWKKVCQANWSFVNKIWRVMFTLDYFQAH